MAMNFGKSKNNTLKNAIRKTEEANAKIARDIPIEKIEETPANEYVFGYDESDIDRLAEEIREHGFDGAIEVVALGDDKYRVISGHQRLRAVIKNGAKSIPCYVSTNLSEAEQYRKLIASNILTRKLTPLAYARAIDLYIKKYLADIPKWGSGEKRPNWGSGGQRKEIAHFFNIGEGAVQRYMAILKMPEPLQLLCNGNDFPFSALTEATSLTEAQKQELSDKVQEYIAEVKARGDAPEGGYLISRTTVIQMINAIRDKAERAANAKAMEQAALPQKSAVSDYDSSSPAERSFLGAPPAPAYMEEETDEDEQALQPENTAPFMPAPEPAPDPGSASFAEPAGSDTAPFTPAEPVQAPVPQPSISVIDFRIEKIAQDLQALSESRAVASNAEAVAQSIKACREAIAQIEDRVLS